LEFVVFNADTNAVIGTVSLSNDIPVLLFVPWQLFALSGNGVAPPFAADVVSPVT